MRAPPEDRFNKEAYEVMGKTRNIPEYTNPGVWGASFEAFKSALPHGRVLDLGCGGGRDAQLFAKAGYEYVGIDFSRSMVEAARRLVPEADFRVMNIYSLEFPRDHFDGFWAVTSLVHVPKDLVSGVLSGISDVVKREGIGFIVMNEVGPGCPAQGYVKDSRGERFFAHYELGEFTQVLERAGFEVLRSEREARTSPFNTKVHLLYLVRNRKESAGQGF